MSSLDAMSVAQVDPPTDALVLTSLARIDYADAFRLALPHGAPETIDGLLRATLLATPAWVSGLMSARDGVVRRLGLKTAEQPGPLPERFVLGQRLGIVRVLARDAREIVLGEDDRHLDFRASLLLEETSPRALVLTTVVLFHHPLGRAYFAPVAPVHRRIVPAMLRAAGMRMASRTSAADAR